MNKTAIKNFAVWARQKLISDITYKAGMLGITEDGIADKLPHSTSDLEFYDIGTKDYAEVSGKEIKQRNALVNAIRKKEKDNGDYKSAFGYVVEEVAYTWFNRLIAIRFMEVNDYLPSGVRVLSSENKAKKEPDLVTTPFDTDLEFTSDEQDKIIQLKDDNKLDELFRMLFIKQCNKLHDVLPELFITLFTILKRMILMLKKRDRSKSSAGCINFITLSLKLLCLDEKAMQKSKKKKYLLRLNFSLLIG